MPRLALSLIVVAAASLGFAVQKADAQISIGFGNGGIRIGNPSFCPPKYCPPKYCPPKYCPPKYCPPVYCPPPVCYPPQPPVYCPPPQTVCPPCYPPYYPQPYPSPYPQPAYRTFGTQGQPRQFTAASGSQFASRAAGRVDPSSLFGR